MPQPANPGAGSAEPAGSGDRQIAQGECIFLIAENSGHYWKTIWNHPANFDLKRTRGSPHVLLPGDLLHVPEMEPGSSDAPTDQVHTFVRKGIPIHFEVKIMRDDLPREGVRYMLDIEGRVESGTIPADGIVRTRLRPLDRVGRLIAGEGEDREEYRLAFGDLDPAHSLTGAAARLRNLGLLGADDSEEGFADALQRFQSSQQLDTGSGLDHASASRLAEVHGS
ncbi:MAG: hypothetical protein H7039_10445 [Bryobacteraceae bacterium]|nr:hypothetical protein [Bryobacteraceae bacterium]